MLGSDADARVLHRDADERLAPAAGLAGRHAHHDDDFPEIGELQGIADEIDEDLLEPFAVAIDEIGNAPVYEVDELELALRRVIGEHIDRLLNQGDEIDRLVFQLHLVRFELGKIEHVIDEVDEGLAARAHDLHEFFLLARERCLHEQTRRPYDAVHRGANLVTHVREEVGLCILRDLGLLFRDLDLLDRVVELVRRLAQALRHAVETGVNFLDLGRAGLDEPEVVAPLGHRIHPLGEALETTGEPRSHENERGEERDDTDEREEVAQMHHARETEDLRIHPRLRHEVISLAADHRRKSAAKRLCSPGPEDCADSIGGTGESLKVLGESPDDTNVLRNRVRDQLAEESVAVGFGELREIVIRNSNDGRRRSGLAEDRDPRLSGVRECVIEAVKKTADLVGRFIATRGDVSHILGGELLGKISRLG